MLKGIIEDNQIHLLGSILLVEKFKFIINNCSNSFKIWSSFIYVWCFFFKLTIFIDDVFSLEISEEVVGHELFVIESEGISEFVFGNSVEHISEDFLIWIGCEFINECSVTLVSPKSNHE